MQSVALVLCVIHLTFAGEHSLLYFCTAVYGHTNLPELTVVGMVNNQQTMYFDSNTMKAVPKKGWMQQYGQEYWDTQTHIIIANYQKYKNIIDFNFKDLFNHSMSAVYTFQVTLGCELEDEGTNQGYCEFGYDGEDWISFDKNTLSWTANETHPQAVIIKNQWNADRPHSEYIKANLEDPCLRWLKDYEKNILRVAPEVSLLQKNSSSPVICHATGFYPKNIMMTWKKNNEDLNEDVEVSSTLPNEDGTFQKSISLSVKSEEWKNNPDVYRCVIQHVGEEKEIVVPLNENNIKTNSASDSIIVKCVVPVIVVVVVGCILALIVFANKKRLIVCRRSREARSSNSTDSVRDSRTHSLQYLCTAVHGDINIPELTVVGMISGQEFMYFDSNTMKAVPKTDWMRDYGGAGFWDTVTQAVIDHYTQHETIMKSVMDQYKQSTPDVQTYQLMYGCEQDDDGTTRGYLQYGYNGEDFLSFDRNTVKWIAGETYPQAIEFRNQWDTKGAKTIYWKTYLESICFEQMKEIVSHSKDALERKVPPEVSLLQKDSSSPVICHATSFYPKDVTMTWKKNNEDHYEDVDISETLPNEDGTFQKSISLSVKSEEWKKNPDLYRCVIQHVGEEEEIVVFLNENNIKTNSASDNIIVMCLVIAIVVIAVLAVSVFAVIKRSMVCRDVKSSNSAGYVKGNNTETTIKIVDDSLPNEN